MKWQCIAGTYAPYLQGLDLTSEDGDTRDSMIVTLVIDVEKFRDIKRKVSEDTGITLDAIPDETNNTMCCSFIMKRAQLKLKEDSI